MKLVIGTMAGFALLIFFILPGIDRMLFPESSGIPETHLHPIYMGIVLLSGLIAACTKMIVEEIKELKKKLDDRDDKG